MKPVIVFVVLLVCFCLIVSDSSAIGRRDRGGCANGQCAAQVSQPMVDVAIPPAPAATVKVIDVPPAPIALAEPAITTISYANATTACGTCDQANHVNKPLRAVGKRLAGKAFKVVAFPVKLLFRRH